MVHHSEYIARLRMLPINYPLQSSFCWVCCICPAAAEPCFELSCQALDIELTAVRANLATRTATLREAQASLSETEGKLHEEYEKSWELGRENMNLQQQLDRLKEDNRQIGQVREPWV